MDIKVLISAPSDQNKQVQKTQQSLEALNKILSPHGHALRVTHWQTNISTGQGERAQDVINAQINDCDVLVAILGDRIGTPTGEFVSGTVEEVEQFLSRRKDREVRFDVHVFFNRSKIDPYNIDADQLRKVQEFRRSLNMKGVNFGEFSSNQELGEMVQLGVSTFIARSPEIVEESIGDASFLQDFDELGFDDAIELAAADMNEVANSMIQLTSDIDSWNTEIDGLVEEAPAAVNGDNSKEFFDRVAASLRKNRENVSPKIDSITEFLASSHARMNYALTIMFEDIAEDNPAEWKSVIETLEASLVPMVEAFKRSLESIVGARDAVNSLPRRRTNMNRAKRELVHEYDRLIETIGSSIAKFSTLTLRE